MGSSKSMNAIVFLSVLAAALFLAATAVLPSDADTGDDNQTTVTYKVVLPKSDYMGAGFEWSYSEHRLILTDFDADIADDCPFVFPDSSSVSIELNGKNVIKVNSSSTAYGFYDPEANLIVSGNGSLKIKTNGQNGSYGFMANSIIIMDTTVTMDLKGTDGDVSGIMCSTVDIARSSITINTTSTDSTTHGIYGGFIRTDSVQFTIDVYGKLSTYGIIAMYDLALNGGCITCNSTSVSDAYGLYAFSTTTVSSNANVYIDTIGTKGYGVTSDNLMINLGFIYAKGSEYAFYGDNMIQSPECSIKNANETSVLPIPNKLTQKDSSVGVIIDNEAQTQITVSPSTAKMREGNSIDIAISYNSPILKNHGVVWTSSDTSIATVNEKGVVTAVKNGTATITATSLVDEDQKSSSEITIGTATGRENVDLWIAIVCGVAGCLVILAVSVLVHRKL